MTIFLKESKQKLLRQVNLSPKDLSLAPDSIGSHSTGTLDDHYAQDKLLKARAVPPALRSSRNHKIKPDVKTQMAFGPKVVKSTETMMQSVEGRSCFEPQSIVQALMDQQ